MLAGVLKRARLLMAVLVAALIGVHAVVRPCGRAGCHRSIVGRWLLEQGGVFADAVHGVEFFGSALAVVAIVGYGLSRLR